MNVLHLYAAQDASIRGRYARAMYHLCSALTEAGGDERAWIHECITAVLVLDVCGFPSEPAPEDGRMPVMPWLVRQLRSLGCADETLALVRSRAAIGLARYGTELRTQNGRNPVNDAREEVGDLLMYLMQARLEGRDVSELVAPIRAALELAD